MQFHVQACVHTSATTQTADRAICRGMRVKHFTLRFPLAQFAEVPEDEATLANRVAAEVLGDPLQCVGYEYNPFPTLAAQDSRPSRACSEGHHSCALGAFALWAQDGDLLLAYSPVGHQISLSVLLAAIHTARNGWQRMESALSCFKKKIHCAVHFSTGLVSRVPRAWWNAWSSYSCVLDKSASEMLRSCLLTDLPTPVLQSTRWQRTA